jgi:hypothetical protein
MKMTRREALFLCVVPLLAQSRPKVAITEDDVAWQTIPQDHRAKAEARLLKQLGKTRAFLFAVGQNVDNEHGSQI